MKKQLLFFVFATVISICSVNAQAMRQSPEERTKEAMAKMAALNLDPSTKTKTEAILGEFYQTQQKEMKALRTNGAMNKEAIMAKRKELVAQRDGKLKAVLSADQLKKWQEEIEPALRPKRVKGNRIN